MKMSKFAFGRVFLVISCAVFATACGNDDNPMGEGNLDNIHSKRLTKIYTNIVEGDWTKWSGEELVYDEVGRLVKEFHYYKGNKGDDGKVYTFDYDGNHVHMKRGNTSVGYDFVLNNDGNAVSCMKGDDVLNFTYTSDGYLASIEYHNSPETYYYTYTWEDGNMVKFIFEASWGSTITSFEYNMEEANTYGIMAYYQNKRSFFYPYIDALDWAFYAGILGKPTKNLPKTYISRNNGYETSGSVSCCFVTGWTEEEAHEQGYSFPVYVIE